MRFLLKTAFLLGLLAFVLPGGAPAEDEADELSVFAAMLGAQAAFQDLAGLCERSPAACRTGRELAAFAGARIGDGAVLAYDVLGSNVAGQLFGAADVPRIDVADAATASATDLLQTGSLSSSSTESPESTAADAVLEPPISTIRPTPATAQANVPLPSPAPRA